MGFAGYAGALPERQKAATKKKTINANLFIDNVKM